MQEVSGFRKGHTPEHVIVNKLGETAILEETAEQAFRSTYTQIIEDNKINAIGQPHISITKLAPQNPIGFTIRTAVYPTIILPDYKETAKKVQEEKRDEKIEVTDKEIDDTILQIQKSKMVSEARDETDRESKELPEFTDELVQSWNFKDVADFRIKLRNDMLKEKTMKEKEKNRMILSDNIIQKSTIPLPQIIIDGEVIKMLAEFKGRIKQMGLSFDDYLKKIEKTEEQLRSEWKPDAIKRAKLQLMLNKIAETENIKAEKEEVEKRVKHTLEHHNKDANEDNVRMYMTTLLTNEKVFEFLEGQN